MKKILTAISIAILGIGLWAGFSQNTGVLTVGFLSFVVLLFTANIDSIAEFKASGTGIEAKTREVIQKAEGTMAELQLLAKQVGKVTLSLVKRSGRIGGYADDEADEIKESILGTLSEVGITETEFREVLHDWNKLTEFDYSHYILGGSTIPEGVSSETLKEWKSLRSGGIKEIPSPKDLQAFLSKHNFLTPEIEEWLKDYQYFIENRCHRRPKEWEQRTQISRLKII